MKGPIYVFYITLAYFFVEFFGGLYYNSLSLVTDSAFMVIDLIGQLCALYAIKMGSRPPDRTRTFGYERVKVLAGLANGMLVLCLLVFVLTSAYHRLGEPEVMEVDKVFVIAVFGLLANIFGAVVLYKHSNEISIKGSFLIMLNDALGSVGVISSTLIIKYTGFYYADPIASLCIVALVLYPTYKLVRQSINILMEGTPSEMDVDYLEKFIYDNFESTKQVKDLRVWSLIPDKNIMTVKIRTDGVSSREKIKKFKQMLQDKFNVHDVFLEVYEV